MQRPPDRAGRSSSAIQVRLVWATPTCELKVWRVCVYCINQQSFFFLLLAFFLGGEDVGEELHRSTPRNAPSSSVTTATVLEFLCTRLLIWPLHERIHTLAHHCALEQKRVRGTCCGPFDNQNSRPCFRAPPPPPPMAARR